MEEYQHPLFFEANELTDKEKEKIRRYFQKKRNSGGGECGFIEKVGDTTYRICFKKKEDQERVLVRGGHTICLPRGELHLTVNETCTVQHKDKSPFSPSQKGNSKGLEKIYKMDIFLMFYLRDNPKASKVLHKQLSSIGCTLELDFDEEEAVVRGDVEKGPGGAFGGAAEKWELQVDQIFIGFTETYICHHVFEARQIKKMLQDRSFLTDDMKMYTESGYAVVVGECKDVKEKIALLEKSVPTCLKLPVVEKHFKLVEEDFTREISTLNPEVKITKGSAMVILEGPDEKVQSGAAKLDELIKNIKEKKVQLPSDLLTFIKTSGAITRYQLRFQQSLRNPVSLEVASDLLLSSLSSVSLEEAEAAVLRDLSVADVELQGAAAVAPELNKVKEILIKAKNQANLVELRVDVSFIPAPSRASVTKVRLAGYTEHVNELKELLHDYQINQVSTQEVLNLPHPELLDCFDKILDMIGMNQTNVTLKPSHLPYPCVLVSGPRCQVQETRQGLTSALAGLTLETLVLDGPGALRYFQGDGKESKELVEASCQVIIKEQPQMADQDAEPVSKCSQNKRVCSFSSARISTSSANRTQNKTAVNKLTLKIRVGNVEEEQVNVLVAPMISKKLTSTKIGKCLLRKGGSAMQNNFGVVAGKWTCTAGNVMTVDAPPSLGCSKIFFIECLPWDGVSGRSVQALDNGLKTCMELCAKQGWSSVALPVIGPGVALKYPLREAIQVLTDKIDQFGLSASHGSHFTIHVVIKPDYPNSEECYQDVYRHLSLNMNQGGQAIFSSVVTDLADITISVGGGVKLQIVFGDITNETTDAVVNTTNFTDFQTDGVCKDILTVAGPQVQAELKKASVKQGDVFTTQSGSFPCKAILHVCGEKDVGVIEQVVCRIIQLCESGAYTSVAIPAICAGTGGLDPGLVAHAILRGVSTTALSSPLQSLTCIRLVLIKINIFLAFKQQATQMFCSADISTANEMQRPPPPVMTIDPGIICTSSTIQQSTFMIVGLCKKSVANAISKLKSLYQDQCSTQSFRMEELADLSQDDVNELRQLVKVMGLHVEEDQSGQGVYTVSGLKDGVNQVMQLIHKS